MKSKKTKEFLYFKKFIGPTTSFNGEKMKIKLFSFLILFITAHFLTGCVTLPHQIWRPWTRTIEGNAAVPLNSNLNISVKGSTLALVGNEELLQEQIKDKVTELVIETRL